MNTRRYSVAIVLCALAVAAYDPSASGDETRRRLTIRGTGNDISVDRSETPTTPAKKPELSRGGAPISVLAEAIRMKESGGSDGAVLGYLKSHAFQIPAIIDLGSVNRLRGAGAGRPVLAYLASVSAIEVGDSGAVGGATAEPAAEIFPSGAPESEPDFAAQSGNPIFGGLFAPSRPSFRNPNESRHARSGPRAPLRPALNPIPTTPTTRREFGGVVLTR
ncbi:MAG: hypothetical protein ACRD16_08835 [Thermoanaerobaculia bacterium]